MIKCILCVATSDPRRLAGICGILGFTLGFALMAAIAGSPILALLFTLLIVASLIAGLMEEC